MQSGVDLVGLVTYQRGIPARRQSPILVLTGLNVEQLHSYDERRYHSAKPPTVVVACAVKVRQREGTLRELSGEV